MSPLCSPSASVCAALVRYTHARVLRAASGVRAHVDVKDAPIFIFLLLRHNDPVFKRRMRLIQGWQLEAESLQTDGWKQINESADVRGINYSYKSAHLLLSLIVVLPLAAKVV